MPAPAVIRSALEAKSRRISEALLQQSDDDHHYQILPEVRESVIFGDHDLLADPPFPAWTWSLAGTC